MEQHKGSKPTGTAGVTRITFGRGQPPKVERVPIRFPRDKIDIENYIATGFARDVDRDSAQAWFGEFRQNREDDFDFDVVSAHDGEVWKLELSEIVPIPFLQLDSDAASYEYELEDLVNYCLAGIDRKSKRYGPGKKILLLYTTEFRFRLSFEVVDILRQDLSGRPQAFDYIYVYRPVSQCEGEALPLHPPPPRWSPSVSRGSVKNRIHREVNIPKAATFLRTSPKEDTQELCT